MSMTSWHTYGYGICTDKIDTTIEQVRVFIDSAPEYKDEIFNWLRQEHGKDTLDKEKLGDIYAEMTLDDIIKLIEEHDNFGETGLSCLIRGVISEKTGIPLVSAKDCNSDLTYVIMTSYYPWEVNRNIALRHISNEDDIKNIFAHHIAVLTNQTLDELDWGEQDIENWG